MTFTKEQLQHIIETDHVQCGDASALARMALAGMEAEPVAWAHRLINKRNGVVHPWVYGSAEACPSEGDIFNIEVMPLYTAPPAPVSVPAAMEMDDDFDSAVEHGKAAGWNACRAAMLQGAEPVSQPCTLREGVAAIRNSGIAIDDEKIKAERDALNEPTCWCHTCRPVTVTDMRFIVCPDCGNKRCHWLPSDKDSWQKVCSTQDCRHGILRRLRPRISC